jgi:hypothetical protein
MWHEYVALARRIVEVETREDITRNRVIFEVVIPRSLIKGRT